MLHVSRAKALLTNAVARRRVLSVALGSFALLAASLLALPSQASQPWQWRDLSQQIPSTVQTAITMVASRGSDWLVSDGTRLWSVNAKEEVNNYSTNAAQYGQIQAIGSDGTSYLIAFRGSNGPTFVKTDLQTWTPVPELRVPQRNVRSIEGKNGTWSVVSEDTTQNGNLPKTWQITMWTEGQPSANLGLPTGASGFVPGCTKDTSSGSMICGSQVAFLPLDGAWYLFAGQSETRNQKLEVIQEGTAGVWRWDGTAFTKLTNAPSARFVSGVWAGDDAILLATSHAVTNPYAADTYWSFNGSSFASYKNEPLEANMLSVDTRAIHAAWTGSAWAIVADKTLVHVRNGAFAVEGDLRDQAYDIAGGADGKAVLVGKREAFAGTEAPSTTMPMLVMLGDTLSTDDVAYLVQPRTGTKNRTELTNMTVTGNVMPANIRNGESFTFRATAVSDSGIKRIDVLVNGAIVTSCDGTTTCAYTQTYWNNGNGTSTRNVLLSARASDTDGHSTASQDYVLRVQNEGVSGSVATSTEIIADNLMPAGLRWSANAESGISYTTWLTPSTTSFTTLEQNGMRVYHVSAFTAGGVRSLEMWVNGALKRECPISTDGIVSCNVRVAQSDYPTGDILVNARVIANNGKEAWTDTTRLTR